MGNLSICLLVFIVGIFLDISVRTWYILKHRKQKEVVVIDRPFWFTKDGKLMRK